MAISTVRGQFKSFTATGETNDAGMPTALTMEIDAASISTNNEQRDGHLVSPDFFDAANFPKITFAATTITGTRPFYQRQLQLAVERARGEFKVGNLFECVLSQTFYEPCSCCGSIWRRN